MNDVARLLFTTASKDNPVWFYRLILIGRNGDLKIQKVFLITT